MIFARPRFYPPAPLDMVNNTNWRVLREWNVGETITIEEAAIRGDLLPEYVKAAVQELHRSGHLTRRGIQAASGHWLQGWYRSY